MLLSVFQWQSRVEWQMVEAGASPVKGGGEVWFRERALGIKVRQ